MTYSTIDVTANTASGSMRPGDLDMANEAEIAQVARPNQEKAPHGLAVSIHTVATVLAASFIHPIALAEMPGRNTAASGWHLGEQAVEGETGVMGDVASNSSGRVRSTRFVRKGRKTETINTASSDGEGFDMAYVAARSVDDLRSQLQSLSAAYLSGLLDIPQLRLILGGHWPESEIVWQLEQVGIHRPLSAMRMAQDDRQRILADLANLVATGAISQRDEAKHTCREVIASQRIEGIYVAPECM